MGITGLDVVQPEGSKCVIVVRGQRTHHLHHTSEAVTGRYGHGGGGMPRSERERAAKIIILSLMILQNSKNARIAKSERQSF